MGFWVSGFGLGCRVVYTLHVHICVYTHMYTKLDDIVITCVLHMFVCMYICIGMCICI